MVALLSALGAIVVCALTEWLHARRVRRVARLAFGPEARPRTWARFSGWIRMAAMGATVWGLVTLIRLDAEGFEFLLGSDGPPVHHLVIALDVSPSMHVPDAGPQSTVTRGDRARDVLRSLLARLDPRRTRVSIVAFYSSARPVVIDTFDPDVVANVLADLPLEHAFTAGKSDMYSGVREARTLAKNWRPRSATFVIVSDGDTLPTQEMPSLPEAFAESLVLGVGNPERGTFIDEHSSRQDVSSLQNLARRLEGQYYDVNARHVSSAVVNFIEGQLSKEKPHDFDRRDAALAATAAGSAALALLPLVLALAGARAVARAKPHVAAHSMMIDHGRLIPATTSHPTPSHVSTGG